MIGGLRWWNGRRLGGKGRIGRCGEEGELADGSALFKYLGLPMDIDQRYDPYDPSNTQEIRYDRQDTLGGLPDIEVTQTKTNEGYA